MYNYNILFYLYHKENHTLYIQPLFLIKDIPYLENTEEIHILHFLYIQYSCRYQFLLLHSQH